jgi:hypothetical protein
MGTEGDFPGDVKLTIHLYLLPRSRMVESYLHSSVCLHGIGLNSLITGANAAVSNVK